MKRVNRQYDIFVNFSLWIQWSIKLSSFQRIRQKVMNRKYYGEH